MTEDAEQIPFMERTRFRRAVLRWYRRHFLGWVELRTYEEYGDPEDEDDYNPYDCKITRRLIPPSELPPKAVHCTGEPGVYNLDLVHFRPNDDLFTAMDEWHWIQYGGFDEALTPKWTGLDHVDMKKVVIIGGIVIAVCIVMYVLLGGGSS